MEVQYGEQYGSEAKSNGDTQYGSGLGQEQVRTGSEDRAWI